MLHSVLLDFVFITGGGQIEVAVLIDRCIPDTYKIDLTVDCHKGVVYAEYYFSICGQEC